MDNDTEACPPSQVVEGYHAAAAVLDEYAGRAYRQRDDNGARMLRVSADNMRDNARHAAATRTTWPRVEQRGSD